MSLSFGHQILIQLSLATPSSLRSSGGCQEPSHMTIIIIIIFADPLSSNHKYPSPLTALILPSLLKSNPNPHCESVNMSDIVVNSIDTDGSSDHPHQHISDTMMDSTVDRIGPHTGTEESARADLEAGNPGPIADQPADGVAAVEPQMKRDPGLLPDLSTAAVSASLVAIVRPTPEGLHSHALLTIAYAWDLITLLVLGILLYALTFALDAVPDKWLGAVRAIMTAVACALLLLLLLLAAFVGYGLIFLDIHH